MTAVVGKGLNTIKSPSRSDNEPIKAQALGGLCKMAEACRRCFFNHGKRAGPKMGDAEGRSYLARDTDVQEKLGGEEPAARTPSERDKSGAPNRMHGVMATIVNLNEESFQQQGPPGERKKGARAAGVESR